MYKCKNCGQLKAFFHLNNDGLCKACAKKGAVEKASKPMPNRTYQVVGLDHHMDAINQVFSIHPDAKLNPKAFKEKYGLDCRIPIYTIKEAKPAQLVSEPTNPYDKHAIKVLANGEHIGYIDRDTAAKFNAPLELATSITAKIKNTIYKEAKISQKGNLYIATSGGLIITVTISFK